MMQGPIHIKPNAKLLHKLFSNPHKPVANYRVKLIVCSVLQGGKYVCKIRNSSGDVYITLKVFRYVTPWSLVDKYICVARTCSHMSRVDDPTLHVQISHHTL